MANLLITAASCLSGRTSLAGGLAVVAGTLFFAAGGGLAAHEAAVKTGVRDKPSIGKVA